MSAPATNVRPAPMTTAAFMEASRFSSSIAAPIPSGTPGLRAFTGGLSMVITAMSFSFLTFTRLLIKRSRLFSRRTCSHRRNFIFLSQLSFQNFSGCGLRQRVAERNRLRTLVVGQAGAAKLNQFHFTELRSRFHHDHRFRNFAP